MAPNIDWDAISSVAESKDVEDDEVMEKVADLLHDAEAGDFSSDSPKLQLLFKSALRILDYREKAMQEILKEQTDLIDEKDEEIEDLNRELQQEKKFAGTTGDTDFSRVEHRKLIESVEMYREQLIDVKRELQDMTQERDTYERDMEAGKKQLKELKSENQELRYNLREYREIMENQQQQKLSTHGQTDAETREKLTQKNKQISELLTQITTLEELNRDLSSGNRNLKIEMENAQEDMERMVDEYEKMRKIIGSSDRFTDDLHRQNAQLKMQITDLREQIRSKTEEEDLIAESVNKKVEEWSRILEERRQKIEEQERVIGVLQNKITSANLDQDRIKVEQLTKKLEEKQKQLKEIESALNQAVGDLEEQTAIVQDLQKNKGTNRETLAYKSQIRNLQADVAKLEESTRAAEKHRATAESEAQENDYKLTEALKRIALLESGQYGLTEAVNEIKECKNQTRLCEQEIVDLTRQANLLEEKLNDLLEENEEYRERLGVDPRDLQDILPLRKSRALRQQQYRAENQVLLKEIERLEEERIDFKRQIRAQAQSHTQKALNEGLGSDDLDLIDRFIEDVKKKRMQGVSPQWPTPTSVEMRSSSKGKMMQTMEELNRESNLSERKLRDAQVENLKLQKECRAIVTENSQLRVAMKEILEAIKKSQETQTQNVKIPSLDKLLRLMDTKHEDTSDSSSHTRAELDQMIGRNDELRNELLHLRAEHASISNERTELLKQVGYLQSEVDAIAQSSVSRQPSVARQVSAKSFPTSGKLDGDSNDMITALNEQLIQTLEEVAKKDLMVTDLKQGLENSKRKLNALRHQTYLLYKEFSDAEKKSESERSKMEEERRMRKEKEEREGVKLEEYQRLLDALNSDPEEMKKKLAETSRKVSLLRANEKTLIRKNKALEATEELLIKERNNLRNESFLIEKAVSERIGYLERHKEMSAFKIASLQRALEGTSPESELLAANKRFDEMTSKYRDLLQKENQFVIDNIKHTGLQEELKIAVEAVASLKQDLSIEKEKRHTLEEAQRKMGEVTKGFNSANVDMTSAIQKVTLLEMKELNERQRADHATKMYNKLKSSLNELENRNSELDQKFSELTKMNMEAQKTERDLRDELAEVVPRSVSDADRKKMALLQEDLVKTKLKMSKLQDIAEISRNQLQSVQSQQQARDRELKSLRQQLKTFQHQTDNNALIGQLHHQVLTLQASESDLERKLSNTRQDVTKLKAKLFKAEKLTDEKEDAVYLTRAECNTKIRNLRKTIQSLRQQFSGALPISQQEKFARTMIRLRGDKKLVEEEMRKMRIEREKLEDQLLEAEVRKKGLEDLRRAIEDKRGADQLTEWCRKMDGLRLQGMKLQRQVTRQNEQISYMERLNNQHENTISSLEEDIVQMLKVQEDHQVEWESRESELERLLDQFQNQQREVNKRAKKLDDFSEILPQTSLSVEDQLKKALETIKEQRKTMTNLQAQVKNLEFESDRLKDARHALEGDITSRDRIINELRLHMPTTVVLPEPHTTDNESKQQLDVAVNTIETLKKRLSAKEQSIERYKELLEESRRDHEMMSAAHERDLLLMQNKIHVKTDDAFNKFKQAATSASQPPGSSAPSASDLRHLNELEDMVREQDAAMSALMERVRSSNADISRHKRALLDTKKQHEAEKMKMQETHDVMLNALRMKLAKKHKQVEATTTELSVTKEELKRQKDANTRAPAASMKNLVQRLKEELAEKEKQQQQLSHALKELRVDLVQQAQENVRAATAGEADAHNVTTLVEKRTAHYKDDIEDLKDEIAQLRRNLKQSEKTETTLKSELRKTLEEAEKKSQVIQRLKSDLHTKETESKDLREKMKRLLRNKGPDAGIKFGEDQPLKIKLSEGRKVEEDEIKPVDAGTKNLSRPSSASSKLPRSVYSSQDGEKKEKLKSEIVNLKREVENLKEKLKKKTEIPDKTTLEVAKWDVKKQWQSKVESLKSKLQDAEKQVTAQDKQIAALRVANSRLEKEKLRKPVIPLNQYTDDAAPPNGLEVKQHLHTIEELSSRLHDLGEENSDLKKMTTLPKNKLITEMQMKNQHLSDQIQDLQKELLTAGLRHETDETLASQFEDRENRMQGRILQLASENTQFQFEIEQIKHDVPRLQERVEFQQRFINLLKSEKAELQQRVDKLKIQRKGPDVGGSGKNIQELEKTVVLMKKVVERVQRENEDLKKAPGVVSNQLLEQLKSENQLLKNRINEMTQQIGGQLSLRYESKTQSVEKLMKENEKLRKDLNKNATTRDRIRDSKQVLQAEYNKLTKDFEEVKKKLTVAESKAPKFAGSGSKGYNSAITSRMLESKLRKTEADLEKKTKEVGGLKDVLEDQRMQENKLNKDVERLQEQVEVLERFPLGAGGSDPNTVRELQLTRLTVARLENEKEELNHLIKTANQKLRNHGLDENGPSTSEQEKEINTTRAENVRLGTEMLILRKENEKLTQDIERMREELSHFDGEFFDEIEDLKYNYSECIKKNVAYEEQLRALSQQFGVAFEIPSSDD